MHLTPDILQGAYDYLRTTPPFRRWKLPEGDEVQFHVVIAKDWKGDYYHHTQHVIRISAGCITHTATLMEAMAHEMIHLRQQLIRDRSHHGAKFQKMAKQVCKQHGFDPKLF